MLRRTLRRSPDQRLLGTVSAAKIGRCHQLLAGTAQQQRQIRANASHSPATGSTDQRRQVGNESCLSSTAAYARSLRAILNSRLQTGRRHHSEAIVSCGLSTSVHWEFWLQVRHVLGRQACQKIWSPPSALGPTRAQVAIINLASRQDCVAPQSNLKTGRYTR